MPWRPEDEHLLRRLEDEAVARALFAALIGAALGGAKLAGLPASDVLHPRAAGLVTELRKRPSGTEAVDAALAGDVARLVRYVDALPLREASPELLHHLALFHRSAAVTLERSAPEAAATAWMRSLAAWLALIEERSYLARLEASVLGGGASCAEPTADVAREVVADIAQRADATARELAPSGRAALLALGRIDEAASVAGLSPEAARRARAFAERRRNAAIESALSVIAEGLDEANVRGETAASGRSLLLRAIPVWTWSANDEAVETFVVHRIDKVGWELYRARDWDALRYLLEPFRPMFEHLAWRIEQDPSRIAYAAPCAQMFVFLSQVDRHAPAKLALAERAVKICPTHRNGRLILAAELCDQAMDSMRTMTVFARKSELDRIEATLARAESLYPRTTELPEARRMLERVKRSRIGV